MAAGRGAEIRPTGPARVTAAWLGGPFDSPSLKGQPGATASVPAATPPCRIGSRMSRYGVLVARRPRRVDAAPALRGFLEAGPPPVYVGFGSMSSQKPLETVPPGRRRAVVGRTAWGDPCGLGGLAATDLLLTVFPLECCAVPVVIPRMAAVVA